MKRMNVFPVAPRAFTAQMLTDQPIRIDGMKLVFDEKVALYPAKMRVEEKDGESDSASGN